jgi:hypothetical protein
MRNVHRWIGFLFLLFIFSNKALSATYKVETVNPPPDGVNDTLKNLLQPQGYRVLDEKGAPWCEVWLRKEMPNLGKPGAPDAKYQSLHIGQLVGILKFNGMGSDYRGQSIKAGTYTMRYCLILQDGNHMGVSPILDFVLLSPVGDDNKDPDAEMTIMDVVAISRKASGTNHPATLLLSSPPDGASDQPVLEKDDMNHWVLKIKSQSKPGADLPIGIIVVGKAEG